VGSLSLHMRKRGRGISVFLQCYFLDIDDILDAKEVLSDGDNEFFFLFVFELSDIDDFEVE